MSVAHSFHGGVSAFVLGRTRLPAAVAVGVGSWVFVFCGCGRAVSVFAPWMVDVVS